MRDQAESLRKQMNYLSRGKKATKVLSIVSGKGGVGKTNLSVNTAIGLSQLGKSVLIVDLDIGMGNVDIVTGVTVKRTIVDMIENRLPIYDIMVTGPGGITFIAGGSGLTSLFELDAIKFSYFIRQLEQLDRQFDYIIFDMGAGLTKSSREFILASHEIILIMTPEPTSITDGYGLMKSIVQLDRAIPFFLVVNNCDNESEGYETAERMKRAAKEFLDKELTVIGILPYDRTVTKAVQVQQPFLLRAPHAKISKAIKKIVLTYSGENDAAKHQKTYQQFLSKLSKWFTSK